MSYKNLDAEIKSYDFPSLEKKSGARFSQEGKAIKFKEFKTKEPAGLSLELKLSKEKNFNVESIIQEHRGLRRQELKEKEQLIEREVSARVDSIKGKEISQARELGIKMAKEEVIERLNLEVDQVIEEFKSFLSQARDSYSQILNHQKQELNEIVKNISKWVILRELKNDGEYLDRLIEKLIIEMNSKANLLIRFNRARLEQMPGVLERLQEKLGKLENIRIEVDYDVDELGLIVESKNGIIDGNFSEQMNKIDQLFSLIEYNE